MNYHGNSTTDAQAIGIAAIFLLIVGLVMYHSPAESQAPTYQGARLDRNAALTGARMCVGETGWTDVDACTAQIGIIARRAARRGVSFSRMAELYSRALRSPQANRRWVPHLHDAPDLPPNWTGASWGLKRPLFANLLRHVESVLAGEVEDTCPDASHFGGWMDSHRMRDGWVRVCSEVDTTSPVQWFWGRR